MLNMLFELTSVCSTMVEHSTLKPQIELLNPDGIPATVTIFTIINKLSF